MHLYITRSGTLRRKDLTLQFEAAPPPAEPIESEGSSENDSEKVVPIRPNAHQETRPVPDDGAEVVRGEKINLPVETIESICVFGEVNLNTKLLNFLSQKKIPLHVFNYYGSHSGTWLPHAEQLSGDLVIRQGESYRDEKIRLGIAGALLEAAMHNLLVNLRYYSEKGAKVQEARDAIAALKNQIPSADSTESLMGLEGSARRHYYGCWKHWLPEAGSKFTRRYHPPENPVNALLSFLNSLLYAAMVNELHRTALYPGISYLHAPQSRRFSLALDVVEPFKPILVDRLLFQLWDRKELGAQDFHAHSNGVLLKDDARKKVVTKWDDTEQKNCAKLHKLLKQYLHWNQRSVFEGQVTKGQFAEIRERVESTRAEKSHVVFYHVDDAKWLQKEELGAGGGNTSNVL